MTGPEVPAVRVVRGEPDEVEVAALVASLIAARTTTTDDLTRPSGWSDRARGLRGEPALRHGRDVWRWSRHP